MRSKLWILCFSIFFLTIGCEKSQQGISPTPDENPPVLPQTQGNAPSSPSDQNQNQELKAQQEKYEQELKELKKQLAELEQKIKNGTATTEEKEFIEKVAKKNNEEKKPENFVEPEENKTTEKNEEEKQNEAADQNKEDNQNEEKISFENRTAFELNKKSISPEENKKTLPEFTKKIVPNQEASPSKYKDGENCGVDAHCESNFCIKINDENPGVCQDPETFTLWSQKLGMLKGINSSAFNPIFILGKKSDLLQAGGWKGNQEYKSSCDSNLPGNIEVATSFVIKKEQHNILDVKIDCKNLDTLEKVPSKQDWYKEYKEDFGITAHSGNLLVGFLAKSCPYEDTHVICDLVPYERSFDPKKGLLGLENLVSYKENQEGAQYLCPKGYVLTGIRGKKGLYVDSLIGECRLLSKLNETYPPPTPKLTAQESKDATKELSPSTQIANCKNIDTSNTNSVSRAVKEFYIRPGAGIQNIAIGCALLDMISNEPPNEIFPLVKESSKSINGYLYLLLNTYTDLVQPLLAYGTGAVTRLRAPHNEVYVGWETQICGDLPPLTNRHIIVEGPSESIATFTPISKALVGGKLSDTENTRKDQSIGKGNNCQKATRTLCPAGNILTGIQVTGSASLQGLSPICGKLN